MRPLACEGAPAPARGSGRSGRHGTLRRIALAGLAFALLSPGDAAGQTPLDDFAARVLGSWEGDDSRHEFTWGVGQRVVRSRSWFADGTGWTLVSEGWWYWDPAEETVRGQTVAVGMGIDLFEYRSRVEGDTIVHDLVSHGEFGGTYVERWAFDGDGYEWSLEQDGARVMGGRYRRSDGDGPIH